MANVAIDHRVGGKVGGRTWTLEQRHCWGLWSPAIIVISLISIGVIINIVISSIVSLNQSLISLIPLIIKVPIL